ASGRDRVVAHLRRGDVVGEMSFVTGEPRTATVIAAVPVLAFELRNEDFGEVVARQPAILANLSRILTRRLADTTAEAAGRRQRGEAVALLVGRSGREAVAEALAAATAPSTRPVAALQAAEQLGQTLPARG